MNKLSTQKRAQILSMMAEGMSCRAICRLLGVGKNTIARLLAEAGQACFEYQDEHLRDLTCKKIQVDEIWSLVGSKEKNTSLEKKAEGHGDIWTWTAICADTKLVPAWLMGGRDFEHAKMFIQDLKDRLLLRVQLTSDGHKSYLQAVEEAFGENVDFAQLVKVYGEPAGTPITQRRYSPGEYVKSYKEVIRGNPEKAYVSTSYVERNNLSIRMGNRRFTRLTNAFSKKIENHYYSMAIYFMHYNFVRIHQSLRMTPAMAAGVSKTLWTMEDVVRMIDAYGVNQKAA